MTLLPGEHEIQLGIPRLTLTTHRLRLEHGLGVEFTVASIMLEALASCEARRKADSMWLILALACAVICAAAFMLGKAEDRPLAILPGAVAAVGIFAYLSSRRAVLIFASDGGDRIVVRTGHLRPEDLVGIIDAVEEAKDQRQRSLP